MLPSAHLKSVIHCRVLQRLQNESTYQITCLTIPRDSRDPNLLVMHKTLCRVTRHVHAGVEHLLRDVKDATVSTLAADVSTLATGLNGLQSRLLQIQEYLSLVLSGKLPVNHDIMYQLQVRPCPARHCSFQLLDSCDTQLGVGMAQLLRLLLVAACTSAASTHRQILDVCMTAHAEVAPGFA